MRTTINTAGLSFEDTFRRPLRAVEKTQGKKNLWVQISFVILFLLGFGLVEVFSASRYQGIQLTGNPLYFGLIHSGFVLGAIFIIIIMQVFPINFWKKMTGLSYLVIMISLIAVFMFPSENGSHRWIPLGATGFNLQPSEFAKIIAVFLGANVFATIKWNLDKKYEDHILRFSITSIPLLLMLIAILLEPDLGNILVIGSVYFIMYILTQSKWKKKDIFALIIAGGLVLLLAFAKEPYRVERVMTHVTFVTTGEIQDEYGSGLQLRNILIGVGSGGMWGKGIGGSRLRYGYFVEVTAFTDSVAAVIFEELGMFLSVFFVGVYVYLFLLMAQVAEKQKDLYKRLVVWGIATWFIGQSMFHFGANVALIPVKGITLPFISYGGSSMISFALASGIVIKIAREEKDT